MLRYFLAFLTIAAGATSAAAQNSDGWTLAEQVLEDGSRAIVLSRQQARGRAEYRVLHERRRIAGVYAEDCHSASSGTDSGVTAERLAAAREQFSMLIGTGRCSLDRDILEGFDAQFARLEEMVRSTPLPDVQAWAPGAAGYLITRDAGVDFRISFAVADLHKSRQGEVEVVTYNPDCRGHTPFLRATASTDGDLAARIAAARRATEAQVRAALAQCSYPGLSADRLMTGFDEAVALTERRLAEDSSRR